MFRLAKEIGSAEFGVYRVVRDEHGFGRSCEKIDADTIVKLTFCLGNCLAPCFLATVLVFLWYGFWDGRTHVERLMRACVVVLREPVVDDDLSLLRCCEPLRVEHLLA